MRRYCVLRMERFAAKGYRHLPDTFLAMLMLRTLSAVALALALLGTPQAAPAPEGPRPPCGGASPEPALPPAGDPPNIQLWPASELPADWRPPTCTGWDGLRFDQLVGLAGRLPSGASAAEGLLTQLGAVSAWPGIRYWSTPRQSCRQLIEDAHALAGPDADQRRPDFNADEMVADRDLYFFQDDNGPGGGAVYRMRLHEVAPDRLVLETENVTAIKVLLVPLFGPGTLRALYILQREQDGGWTYYSLSGATAAASALAGGHDASYVNRALALYAHLAAIDPCDPALRAD
jgi:hypothetical protein